MIKQTNVAKWVLPIIYFDFSLDIYYSIFLFVLINAILRLLFLLLQSVAESMAQQFHRLVWFPYFAK